MEEIILYHMAWVILCGIHMILTLKEVLHWSLNYANVYVVNMVHSEKGSKRDKKIPKDFQKKRSILGRNHK